MKNRLSVCLSLLCLTLGASAAPSPAQTNASAADTYAIVLDATKKAAYLSALLPAVESSGPQRLLLEDLASDSAWTLSVDDGPTRSIKVPGGGYNSDRQEKPWINQASVKDHVVYRRSITIPKVIDRQVTVVEFGAVNCGADIALIDGDTVKPVTSHVGAMMPFTADLTDLVTPGKSYVLQVTAYPAKHYGNRTPRGFLSPEAWTTPKERGFSSRNPAGITKWVRLAVYPELYIRDVFVRPSVTKAELGGTVWLRNHAAAEKTVTLGGEFTSWNRSPWAYPTVPTVTITVPANGEISVELPPIPWTLGAQSWWWPNKPFREDYQAQLHLLNVTVNEGTDLMHRWQQRFGFVEWSEGPFYYRVNGVRVNHLGDGTPEPAMSEYDCYSVAPAFLPPTRAGSGFPETVRRYQRMGMCTYRVHQSTPTPYMMDVADEQGFMLIPETAIRGNQEQWDDVLIPQTVKELAQVCRNHPSTCRYSLLNETHPEWVGPLADAIVTVDATRPLVFEDCIQKKVGAVLGRNGTHAYAMLHYQPHPKQAQMISGVGECAWNGGGRRPKEWLEDFAFLALDGRCADVAYYAGWDWINYWPNFLEGMDAKRHAWQQKESWHADRIDGVDGWNSPVIAWVQRAFHPYLVADRDFYQRNGVFSPTWPQQIPTYAPGEPITRELTLFNDAFSGGLDFTLSWSAHWYTADGPLASSGTLADIHIAYGFHADRQLTFTAPASATRRTLFLTYESNRDGRPVFIDRSVRLVIDPTLQTKATFAGEDTTTGGTWPGHFGSIGYALAGNQAQVPADMSITWNKGSLRTWAATTTDPRALCINPDPARERQATAYFGKDANLTVDLGETPHLLSVYCVDWKRRGLKQDVILSDARTGRELARRTIGDFKAGCWLSWIASGKVFITVQQQAGVNAGISGICIDPARGDRQSLQPHAEPQPPALAGAHVTALSSYDHSSPAK